jgi:transcriptional regulator with XRE-family HTH domain
MENSYALLMEKWNDRLRKARDSAGVSDTDIARTCDVSNPTVNGWMTGKIETIKSHNLLSVCRLLGVSPYYIMFGERGDTEIIQPSVSQPIATSDVIRLLTEFALSSDEGRMRILDAAVDARRLFPRG